MAGGRKILSEVILRLNDGNKASHRQDQMTRIKGEERESVAKNPRQRVTLKLILLATSSS